MHAKRFQASTLKYQAAEKTSTVNIKHHPSLDADMQQKCIPHFPQLFIWQSKGNVTKPICFLLPRDLQQ